MVESDQQTKRVVLVDDEPAAITNLRTVLDGFDALEVAAEVHDGSTAIHTITELRPDIVFLDIEMPEVNGFEVANKTAHLNYQLVFVTAYSKYALDAFDTNAIDYLMKPVRPSLLDKCVRKMLYQEELVLEALQKESNITGTISLYDGDTTRIVNVDHICFIEGIGRYRRVHLDGNGTALHRTATIVSDTTLDVFEQQLPSSKFSRLHRSYIINLAKLLSVMSEQRRYFVKLLETEVLIPVSRANVSKLKRMF